MHRQAGDAGQGQRVTSQACAAIVRAQPGLAQPLAGGVEQGLLAGIQPPARGGLGAGAGDVATRAATRQLDVAARDVQAQVAAGRLDQWAAL
ncbi:hypothetical protein [Melaminivora sp.]